MSSDPCGVRQNAPKVVERDSEWTVTVMAPGVSSDDLVICIENGVLAVKGETRTSTHTSFVNTRTNFVPTKIDAAKAHATHGDGIITVTVPKKKEVAPLEVTIKVHGHAADMSNSDDTDGEDDTDSDDIHYLTLAAPGIAARELQVTAKGRLLRVIGESKRTATGAKLLRIFQLPHRR